MTSRRSQKRPSPDVAQIRVPHERDHVGTFGGLRDQQDDPPHFIKQRQPTHFFAFYFNFLFSFLVSCWKLLTRPSIYPLLPGTRWVKVRLAWRSIGLESIRWSREYTTRSKSGQCTFKALNKRLAFSSPQIPQDAAPNWLFLR